MAEGFTKFPRFFPLKHIQRGRKPQLDDNKVPFKTTRAGIKLKDTITTSRDDTKGAFCLSEMGMLLICLQKHEYQQNFCSQEITNFNKCADNHFVKLGKRKARRSEGGYMPGEKLDHVGLSVFLKKYPNI